MKRLKAILSKISRHIINKNIREDPDIYNIKDKMNENKEKWKSHLERMNNTRLTKQTHLVVWYYKFSVWSIALGKTSFNDFINVLGAPPNTLMKM